MSLRRALVFIALVSLFPLQWFGMLGFGGHAGHVVHAISAGAAIFGAVAAGKAAGGFASVAAAQKVICGVRERVYKPNASNHKVYAELYKLYRDAHDAFGTRAGRGALGHVMKELIRIRERQR